MPNDDPIIDTVLGIPTGPSLRERLKLAGADPESILLRIADLAYNARSSSVQLQACRFLVAILDIPSYARRAGLLDHTRQIGGCMGPEKVDEASSPLYSDDYGSAEMSASSDLGGSVETPAASWERVVAEDVPVGGSNGA